MTSFVTRFVTEEVMPVEEKRCDTCENFEEGTKTCHKNAPVPLVLRKHREFNQSFLVRPPVQLDDWCNEWKRK